MPEQSERTHVAVLGTGIMGAGVARSLIRAGFDVTAWNRDRSKADALADDGLSVASSAADAVGGADLVLTVLFDADSVIDVMADAAASVPAGAVWLQCSTIGLDGMRRAAELAAEHGLALVDAPMLGTKKPAEEGKLTMLVSGEPKLVERARPVLDAIGAKTVVAGDSVGQASALKLAANAWIQTLTAALAQSIGIARGLSLDPQLFLDAIAGGATDTPYAHVKGAAMISGDYTPSFGLDGVIKDLGLIEAGAIRGHVDDSLLAAVRAAYEFASEAGHGDDDMAAVFETFRPDGAGPDGAVPTRSDR